jgi:hypothetical protein
VPGHPLLSVQLPPLVPGKPLLTVQSPPLVPAISRRYQNSFE